MLNLLNLSIGTTISFVNGGETEYTETIVHVDYADTTGVIYTTLDMNDRAGHTLWIAGINTGSNIDFRQITKVH